MLVYAIAALKTRTIARRLVAFIQIDDKVVLHRRTLQIAVGESRPAIGCRFFVPVS